MTLFLTTGQYMRLAAPHIKEQRRYFATGRASKFPTIDTTLWVGAPTETSYDPDGLAAPWVEITHLVDDAATKLRMWDEGPVSKWQASVSGWQFNSDMIGHDQGILCLRRMWPDVENYGGWSNWRVWFLGYFKQDTITHDHTDAKGWTAVVEGVSQYADKVRARAEVLQRTDLARGQAVRTSPLLADMALMANKGEFLGLPTNSGQNLVDGDDAVPMISANEPTPAPTPYSLDVQNGDKLRINEVYLRPPVGYPDGLQWFEIVNIHSTSPATLAEHAIAHYDQNGDHVATVALDKFFLSAGQGWAPSGAGLAQDVTDSTPNPISITNGNVLQGVAQIRINHEQMQVQQVSPGTLRVSRPNKTPGFVHAAGSAIDKPGDVQAPTPTVIPPKGFLIIVENRRRFEEMFSVPPGALVIEWRDQNFADGRFGGIAPSVMRLDTTQGSLRLLAPSPTVPGAYVEIDRVTWGIGDDTAGGGSLWNGDRVPVPAAGHSFRRRAEGGGVGPPLNYDSHSAADWVSEDVPTPGRRLSGKDADGNQDMADTAWFSVQLPALTCELAQDLNDGDTTVYVNNTGGFYADREKHILIVATVVDYLTKTRDTFTLSEAWAGGNVPAGTRLYPVDDSGVAHDAWPVGSVSWTRKQEPVPGSYTIHVSTLANPVYPDEGEWHDLKADDWVQVVNHRRIAVANLTQDLENGGQTVHVDSTNEWPLQGILTLRYPSQDGSTVIATDARYRAITPTTAQLSSPWVGGRVRWDSIHTVASATLSPGLTQEHVIASATGVPYRARHVLFVCDAMTNLSRFRLNSFHVWPAIAATSDPDAQVDGTDVSDFVRYLLVERFGLPAAKYTSIAHALLSSVSSRETSYSAVLRDAAESTASHLRWTLADGARWRPLPELGSVTGDDEDVDFTFHLSDYVRLRGVRAERNLVSQVRLRYQVSGSRDVRVIVYPNNTEMAQMALDPDRGAVFEFPRTVIVPSDLAAAKLARREYNKRAAPVRVTLALSFPCTDWLHPLAVVGLDTTVDATADSTKRALVGRYVVRSIDEGRAGRFPTETVECEVSMDRIGLL